MPPTTQRTQAPEIATRYGLERVPETLVQLARLVARQDTDLEEIGRVIAKSPSITARLLRFANPGAELEGDYAISTVDEALMRTGLAPVILLAMLDPLSRAVLNAFEMFLAPLGPAPLETLQPLAGEHILASVHFEGKATGTVQLRLSPGDAQLIAGAALGIGGETLTATDIEDVIGELANIVGGKLESNLCDMGIACKLASPQVSRLTAFHKPASAGGICERLGFSGARLTVFVDVSVNPWSE